MNIKKIYVGGWFQRTTLQLSEVYDFLRGEESPLSLDSEKLRELRGNLELESVELEIDDLEYINVQTSDKVRIKIVEDGLIVLSSEEMDLGRERLQADIGNLTNYYEKKLSPALSYLFSLGAPIPKELANIKTVYPYFVVLENSSADEIHGLLDQFGQNKYFEVSGESFDIYRGDKIYIINMRGMKFGSVAKFIEEQIFLREFKGQLHRYLNLHRIIWERIDEVKRQGKIRGRDIGALRDKVEGYSKTVNLIEARINQMNAYLRTRESIVKEDEELRYFMEVIGYRYEAMANTLSYMQDIWVMTKNYVDSSMALFSDLHSESTDSSIHSLTIVTSMGVGATLIGLFTTSSAPEFTVFGVFYFLALAAIGFSVAKIMKWIYGRRSYKISEVDYDKDIK